MNRPNVIVIIADSLRLDHCGCYGNNWIRTPNIDRLAAMGTRFTNAYPESLPTIPVRRAMWTGRRTYPFRNYKPIPWDIVNLPGWQPMNHDEPTIAELLAGEGYQTGLVTDTLPVFAPGMNFERGFNQAIRIRGQQQDRWRSPASVTDDELEAMTFNDEHKKALEPILRQYIANSHMRKEEADWLAPLVYREAMRFVEDNAPKADQAAAKATPFYLVVDTFDPHEPWDPPAHYTQLYDPDYQGRGKLGTHDRYGKADWLTPRELKHMRALYAGEVTMVDTWLGKFMDKLEQLQLLSNTIILFISDHGHTLGEHGLTGKISHAMYSELMRIPALYYDPQLEGGRTATGMVYNIDFVSTLMNRLGIQGRQPLDGIDLSQMIGGVHGGRPYLTSAFKDYAWVRRGKYVLIAHFKGTQFQLYDLEDDPNCDRNLARTNRDLCQELFALALADAGGHLPLYDKETTFADGQAEQAPPPPQQD